MSRYNRPVAEALLAGVVVAMLGLAAPLSAQEANAPAAAAAVATTSATAGVCLTGVFIVFLIYRSDRRIVGGQPMEKGLPHSRIFWWSSPVTSTVTYDRACAYPPQPWISSWALRQSKK